MLASLPPYVWHKASNKICTSSWFLFYTSLGSHLKMTLTLLQTGLFFHTGCFSLWKTFPDDVTNLPQPNRNFHTVFNSSCVCICVKSLWGFLWYACMYNLCMILIWLLAVNQRIQKHIPALQMTETGRRDPLSWRLELGHIWSAYITVGWLLVVLRHYGNSLLPVLMFSRESINPVCICFHNI